MPSSYQDNGTPCLLGPQIIKKRKQKIRIARISDLFIPAIPYHCQRSSQGPVSLPISRPESTQSSDVELDFAKLKHEIFRNRLRCLLTAWFNTLVSTSYSSAKSRSSITLRPRRAKIRWAISLPLLIDILRVRRSAWRNFTITYIRGNLSLQSPLVS